MTGRLTKDALFKQSGGYDILEFDIANNGWKKGDVQYFKVTVFGKQAQSLRPYAVKGKQVAVIGAVKIDRWTGADGTAKITVGVNASSVTLMAGPGTAEEKRDEKEPYSGDDVPF
jgi:single-strand DNA-binding protein